MKIAVFSARAYDKRFLDEANDKLFSDNGFQLIYHAIELSEETVPLARDCEAVCVFVNDQLNAQVLEGLHQNGTRVVLLRCAGFNNVNLEAAEKLGLSVRRVAAYSPQSVAEFTVALIQTLNRHTHRSYNRVREGNFNLDGLLGFTLHGKTVGIVGTGKIGLATARILKGFGCHVLAYDPAQAPDFTALGEYVELDKLLQQSDIVTLHCPLMDSTYHLINSTTLDQMKPGAMLVNSSRGPLLDTNAVIAALKTRRLGALAIDVYEQESSLFYSDRSSDIITDDVFQRLMTFPNVLVSGHQGFFTVESLQEISKVTLSNLRSFVEGVPCQNSLVN